MPVQQVVYPSDNNNKNFNNWNELADLSGSNVDLGRWDVVAINGRDVDGQSQYYNCRLWIVSIGQWWWQGEEGWMPVGKRKIVGN